MHSKKGRIREGGLFVGQLIQNDPRKCQLPFPSRVGVFKSQIELSLNTRFPTS